MTLSRATTAVDMTAAFLVTNDAIVGDWFERAGHTLAFRVCGRAVSMDDAERAIPTSGATVLVIDQDRADDVAWAISAAARHRTIWDERNPALALASPRELEVLSMIAAGYLTSDIATRLVLSSETIKSHVQN